MQKKKTSNKKEPQKNLLFGGGFKIYWIYGIIALIFLALQFSSANSAEEISETEFFKKVENQDVKKVTFVTNANYAEVELKNSTEKVPKMIFIVTDMKDIKEQIREKQTNDYVVEIGAREESKLFGEILSWILPLAIFIGIWFFIMKRMSGGAGGGGGQIFNI